MFPDFIALPWLISSYRRKLQQRVRPTFSVPELCDGLGFDEAQARYAISICETKQYVRRLSDSSYEILPDVMQYEFIFPDVPRPDGPVEINLSELAGFSGVNQKTIANQGIKSRPEPLQKKGGKLYFSYDEIATWFNTLMPDSMIPADPGEFLDWKSRQR